MLYISIYSEKWKKILIVDASDSDRRLMSGLLTRAGYEPIVAEDMEAAKQEVTKLSPGAVIMGKKIFYSKYSPYWRK